MPKSNLQIAELCFDNSFRFERIVWLAGEQDQPSENFKEFCTELDDTDVKKWAKCLKVKKRELDEAIEEGGFALIAEWFRDAGYEGFLVQVATPVPSRFTETGHCDSGFGHYTANWFYANSLPSDELLDEMIAWRKGVHDMCRKRARRGGR